MNALQLTATINQLVCGYHVEWKPCGSDRLIHPGTMDPPFLLSASEKSSWPRQFWFFQVLPHDEGAAFGIVECMSARGFTFSLIREPGDSTYLGGFRMNGDGTRLAKGDTPAIAICSGVLLALGGGG